MAREQRGSVPVDDPSGGRSSPGDLTSQVRDALAHLHDPAYLETHPLTRFLPREQNPRRALLGRALRQSLLDALESLHPGRDSGGLARHSHLLQLRYVEGLGVADVQEQLAISRTEYYREHRRAVEAVAAILRSRWGVGETAGAPVKGAAGDAGEGVSSLTGTPRPPHNLPLQLTSFVGREREIAEVSRLLGTTRLLTLTGTGGCGKTRLAYESASDLLDEHPEQHLDGAWAVEFAPLADASLVSQTVAAALGLREEPGRPILDTLVDHLRSKKCLLVLDNCEHLLDPCARLADALLHACPGVQILATSREALGIAGETSYRVPSLALPDLQALPPLGELAACESVRLFVERARAAQPSFDLTEQEAAAIAQICWRLDGMPLAIELAAARVRGLTVQGIWRRLDDRLRLLTGGSRTALRRQQTLRATIDWSYDLLSEPERCLFRRLAVFSGGWSPEAAEEVCVGEASQASIEQDDVLALLLRLVDRSLVVADTDMGQERYRFPETIRQYAGEKLLDSGDMARVRDRHRDWYQGLVERAEPELVGPDSLAWLDRLEREHDNLRAALSWCLERDVAAGLEIVGRMREYFYLRSYANEGRSWATEVLARSSGESVARVRALNTAAISARIQGAGVASRRLFEESLGLARQLEDRSGLGYAALQLAMALAFEGEGDAAVPLAEEAILIGRELGETWMVVFALRVLGNLMTSRGELDEARQLLEESLTLARVAGHRLSIAFGIMDLGRVWLVGGELFRARALIEESLGLFEEVDYGAGLVLARLCRAYVAIAEGDAQCAKALLIENVEEARQTELRTAAWGMSLRLAGLLAVDARAFARGVRLFGAYETARQRFVVDFDASHREMFLATLSKARSALGEEAFARAFAEGQTMTLEEAVEHALRDEE